MLYILERSSWLYIVVVCTRFCKQVIAIQYYKTNCLLHPRSRETQNNKGGKAGLKLGTPGDTKARQK